MNASKTTPYIVCVAAAVLVLTAQTSLAGSATWLSSPQDSAWENPNNWTPGGPPNGPNDIATFAQSSQRYPGISTSVEVNSIVFSSGSPSFGISLLSFGGGAKLVISGVGVINNSGVLQSFFARDSESLIFSNASTAATALMVIANGDGSGTVGTIFNDMSTAAGASIFNGGAPDWNGRTVFNGASTADHASISNKGSGGSHSDGGQTIFNGSSTAANASIENWESDGEVTNNVSYTVFNDTSTAGHATITSHGVFCGCGAGSTTTFGGSSTADSAILIAKGGTDYYHSGGIIFEGTSTGGTARVEVFDNGYLDIRNHQSGVTIGSIEGSGHAYLGTNDLTIGTNNIDTSFSGVVSNDGHAGSLAKVGSGVLSLENNNSIGDTVGLMVVSGSIIKLDYTGPPDVIASLKVNGVAQPPGIYGGPMSGAPHIIPQFAGPGTISAGPLSTLGNISTRAFVQAGDDVMIGGFIVQGAEPKRVIVRALGPELTQFGVPNVLLNPTLELHDHTGALIASNDNWMTTIIAGIITTNQVADIRNSGYAPTDSRESAIVADLPAGNYTAIVRGVSNGTGVALAEVYDLNPQPDSSLRNISTRSFVRTDDKVMIGGFMLAGNETKRVIVRAIGPELTQYGVPNALADPTLELHDGTGTLIALNDSWLHTIVGGIVTSGQVQDIRDSGHAPTDSRESAIIATLPPGNYTAIVRGVNNTTGIGLVEVYDLN